LSTLFIFCSKVPIFCRLTELNGFVEKLITVQAALYSDYFPYQPVWNTSELGDRALFVDYQLKKTLPVYNNSWMKPQMAGSQGL
jgi:hypothetical protein